MKQIHSIAVLFSIPLLFFSCSKSNLNIPDPSIISRQDYVKDLETLEEFMNGIYITLSNQYTLGYNQVYGDLAADNIKPLSGQTAFNAHYNWSQIADDQTAIIPAATHSNLNALWTCGYRIARLCSFVVEKADEFKQQNISKANALKGQALALRALVYHDLVNHFAQPYQFTADASHPGISYVTTSNWTEQVSGRQPVSEVYSNLIADLQLAIDLLASGSANKLLMNRLAAKALLARVFLFKRDYQQAKNMAREVISAVPLMTTGYPAELFKSTETEALFQLPSRPPSGSNWASFYFRSTVQFVATSDIVTILNERPNDLRKNWVTLVSGAYRIVKYPQGVIPEITSAPRSYYLTLLRSSEMYLTAAESYAQLSNSDSANFFLDAIRKRADITAPASTATGAALVDAIQKERRKEFAFEGFRLFDLLRTAQPVNRGDAPSTAKLLSYPNEKAIAPIPLLDIQLSGLQQNTGY